MSDLVEELAPLHDLGSYVGWDAAWGKLHLDGLFTLDELEAILLHVKALQAAGAYHAE